MPLRKVAVLRYLEGASPKESRICAFLSIILCKAFEKVRRRGEEEIKIRRLKGLIFVQTLVKGEKRKWKNRRKFTLAT